MHVEGVDLKRRWFFHPRLEKTKELVDACFALLLAITDKPCWR